MKRQSKWIIIIVIIGCWVCVFAAAVYFFGYSAIRIGLDIKRMESRRRVLLYQTDHQALLEACKELSKQVVAGNLKIDQYRFYTIYGTPDSETQLLTQPILDLKPFQVYIDKNGRVDLIMSPTVMYGVRADPDGIERGDIELIPGLWYFDEDFRVHPEHKTEIEELLKKKKKADSPSMP